VYRAFELTIDENVLYDDWFRKCVSAGKKLMSPLENDIDNLLREVLNNGTIDGTALSARYFPTLKRDIFLSYSHNDQDLAYGVAGMMSSYFKLEAFTDTCFWGSADKLLKEIDDEYCWQEKSKTYDYKKRNFSTSHVHAMLTAAIMKAMDSAEVVIFLNTSNSVPDLKETIDKDGYDEYTLSPWIYEEMLLTTMLKETNWEVYRRDWRHDEKVVLEHFDKGLRVKYKLPKANLISLTLDDIYEWYKNYENRQKAESRQYDGLFLDSWEKEKHPLNVLYEMKCGIERQN
jgi:hypothetical protein